MENLTQDFFIGGLKVELSFDKEEGDLSYIPSFKYFSADRVCAVPDIKVRVGQYRRNEKKDNYKKIKTTNGFVLVENIKNRFRIKVCGNDGITLSTMDCNKTFTSCICELSGSAKNKSLGLKTALLVIYISASSYFNRIMVHSSTVRKDGKAYCFLGDSGEGKSTQSELWTKNIKGSTILNDDMPILQLEDDKVKVWGSPWSGKTNYYINDSADLSAMVMMSHGKNNNIKKVEGIESFKDLMSSCSCFKLCKMSYSQLQNNVIKIVNHYPMYEMSCLPEPEAAIMCYNTIKSHKEYH